MYNLLRVFKTDISAVLTVKSGLGPYKLEVSKKTVHGKEEDDTGDDNGW